MGLDGTAVQTASAPSIDITATIDPKTSFAHQQNGIPFVRELAVTNVGEGTLENVELIFSSDPAFMSGKKITLHRLGPGESYKAVAVDMVASATYLSEMRETIVARISVEAKCMESVVGSYASSLCVLAFDEWAGLSSLPEILASFSQPNHPAVEEILRSASDLLRKNGKNSDLDGYQSKDRSRVWEIANAVYGAISALNLTYSNPPASFEQTGQKIRTPDRILESRLATCLDLCLLFSSCLEQAGLHPVVLMKKGHSFAGVWLSNDQFASASVDDLQVLRKRSRLGDFVVFETTLLTGTAPATFQQAVDHAKRYLNEDHEFELAIDIHRARLERILPLPIRTQKGEIVAVANSAEIPSAPFTLSAPRLIEEGLDAEDTVITESPSARLDRWKRKLLDLSLRNRLLNFKQSKSTVPIVCADPAVLEDTLAEGKKLRFRSISSVVNANDPRNQEILQARYKTDVLKGVLEEALTHGELYSELSEEELSGRLVEIYRSARSAFEEGGANTLFLAFGFLCWTETAATEKVYRAPLILIPVTLERKSVQHGFSLLIHDDEARVNASLLEMLRQDFELEVPGVDPLPTDQAGINVDLVWQKFRRAVKDIPRWEVQEDVSLGLFSFAKYLMWKDLQDRTDDLKRSPVVQHLIDLPGVAYPDQGEFPEPETLDEKRHPALTFAPMIADSSQLSAVYAAADGKSFVLDGPPGTGKSQTITNIIAQCLALGKTVLFVSEKMAALEVVQRRLKQIGLERFCLQLHSAKAKKNEVIEHLGATWMSGKRQSSADWQREADRLASLRDDLNHYVVELHKRYPNGLTPFEATAKVLEGRNFPSCEFGWKGATKHGQSELEGLREVVEALVIRAAQVRDLRDNTYRGIFSDNWSPSWERDFRQDSEVLKEAAAQLAPIVDRVLAALKLSKRELSWEQLSALDELSGALLNSASVPSAAVVPLSTAVFRSQCTIAVDHLRRRNAAWASLGARYEESATSRPLGALLGNLRSARQEWWPKSWFGIRRVQGALASVSRDAKVGGEELERDLVQLMIAADHEKHIEEADKDLQAKFGQFWRGKHTEPESLERLVLWGKEFEASLRAADVLLSEPSSTLEERLHGILSADHSAFRPQGTITSNLLALRSGFAKLLLVLQSFETKVQCEKRTVFGELSAGGALSALIDKASNWLTNLGTLRSWCSWNESRNRAIQSGLKPIVDLLERGDCQGATLEKLFEYNYCRWWIGEVLDAVPVLCKFVSQEHEKRIENFVRTDERFATITKEYLTAKLSQRIPQSNVEPGSSSELGLLAREMNKKSRHMSLRSLVQKMPTVLSRLSPCMMMSPMSVAQYLDAAHPLFDVVVFDEASQIPVWDAIGAIARGSQLVVAGDPKQLPPTNFFSRTTDPDVDENDESEIEELESILDECNAIKLAPQHLKWHYRSRNESLIAFSNKEYYGNRLITFPSPVTQDTAVKYHGINGVYDRSQSRTNRSEAEAVATFVISHLKGQNGKIKDGDWLTIGVVTFNAQQQKLIEDLLDQERQRNPELEPYFSKDASEYVLIKNLENVQGDERDVMVFSTTYGQDASGKRSMNFGPLNRDGGERRLNVAITRARVGLHLFSSLGPEHIDLSKTRKRGVADFKHFLEYAQRGPRAMAEAVDSPGGETESIFEDQVCEMLRSKGWTVHAQVGCSGYRIDLGVVDPRTPGRYLLGIECDGAMYHRAATARDRDRLRAMVLRGLGWRLHRIWSTDWWSNPQQELAKVDDVLNHLLLNNDNSTAIPTVAEDSEKQTETKTEDAKEGMPYASLATTEALNAEDDLNLLFPLEIPKPSVYVRASLQSFEASDAFYERSADTLIQSSIVSILKLEAPITADILVKRISESWGFGRSGNRIRERIVKLIPRGTPRTTESGVIFFWPEGTQPATYSGFRINSPDVEAMRDVDEICKQELANLLLYAVKQHAGVSEQQVVRDACHLLGIRRITEKASERMTSVLKKMVKGQVISIVGESLV